MPPGPPSVLVVGGTGFVGRHLFPVLTEAGYQVRLTSRSPSAALERYPGQTWVELDLERASTLRGALGGCRAAVYLAHGLRAAGDLAGQEAAAARSFAFAAADAGVERIVYLGGVAPAGPASPHLAARLATGRILRSGPVPTVELRAGMIVGAGSEGFRITRDLAARLPAMVLPRWLESRQQPVALDDILVALRTALELPGPGPAVYDVPGPEILTGREILLRLARLMGHDPVTVGIPFVTPRLSAWWIRLVTRADPLLAARLVEGLGSDLVAPDEGIWRLLPGHLRLGFDEAARLALAAEAEGVGGAGRMVERLAHRVSRRPRPAPPLDEAPRR